MGERLRERERERKSEQLAWGVIGYESVEEGGEWGKLSSEELHELCC